MNKKNPEDGVGAQTSSTVQQSRWWFVYHFWAGLCAKLCLDMSGLWNRILPTQQATESAHDYASRYTCISGVLAVVVVAVGYWLSTLLVAAIQHTNFRPNAQRALKLALPFAYFGVLIMLTMLTGSWLSAQSNKSAPSTAPSIQTISEPMELDLNAGMCRLAERGYGVKPDPILVNGRRDGSKCRTFVTDDALKARSICVLSGVHLSSAPSASYYGCQVSREIKSFMFTAQLEPKDINASDIDCSFLCY
jgi:hypothetical protein